MSERQAERTLVKSPPELWAEISDVEALARHLGTFGEIRITRLEPETTVAWEGDTARGTVELSAAGWGTKVTLTAVPTQEPAREPANEREPEPAPAPTVATTPPREPQWTASTDQKVRDRYIGSAPAVRPAPVVARPAPAETQPEPALKQPAPAQKPEKPALQQRAPAGDAPATAKSPPLRGFVARWKAFFYGPDVATAAVGATTDSPDQQASQPVAPSPAEPATPQVTVEPVPPPPPPEPAPVPLPSRPPEPPPAAAQASDESLAEDEIVGVLTNVLDELGSARHRPFSRAD